MIYWQLSNSLPASCNGVFPYMSGGFLFLENSMNSCQMSIRLSCLAASINFSWGVSLQKPVSASTDCLQALHTDLHLIKVAQSIMLNIILAMWGAFFPEITKGNVDLTSQFIFTLVNGDLQSQCCHVEPKYILREAWWSYAWVFDYVTMTSLTYFICCFLLALSSMCV